MDIRVYYSVTPGSPAAAAIERLDAAARDLQKAENALLKKYGVGEKPLHFKKALINALPEWNKPTDLTALHFVLGRFGAGRLAGFAIAPAGTNIASPTTVHEAWLAAVAERELQWSFDKKHGFFVPNRKTPEGKAIAAELEKLPASFGCKDLDAVVILAKPAKDGGSLGSAVARRTVGFYVGVGSGGMYTSHCSLHRPKDHPAVIGVPGAALRDENAVLVKGLKELKASFVATLLTE